MWPSPHLVRSARFERAATRLGRSGRSNEPRYERTRVQKGTVAKHASIGLPKHRYILTLHTRIGQQTSSRQLFLACFGARCEGAWKAAGARRQVIHRHRSQIPARLVYTIATYAARDYPFKMRQVRFDH